MESLARKILDLGSESAECMINLQVDYNGGLWIVSLPFLDATGSSPDFQEAKRRLFEYIDFLWNEYVLCPEEELGETGICSEICFWNCFAPFVSVVSC
jgi:hypothetical protein